MEKCNAVMVKAETKPPWGPHPALLCTMPKGHEGGHTAPGPKALRRMFPM